jgi:hypothetical protein
LDRVEHRGGGALRLDRLALVGQDRRDRARYLAGERHLDEDQRLIDQRRMKEGVAAAVRRIDAPAQILPVANFMHRLVADDLFQDHGGRRPVDAAQHEEPPVEPRREQVDEILVDDGEIVAVIHGVKKLLAHAHERSGAAGSEVEPAKQFEAARLAGAMQLGGGFGGRRSPPGGDRRIDAGLIMPEGARQRLKEGDARPGGQIGIIVENFVGERHTRGFTTAGQQRLAELDDTIGAPARRRAARDQGAAAVGDALQHLTEERGIHRHHRTVCLSVKQLIIATKDDKLAKAIAVIVVPP